MNTFRLSILVSWLIFIIIHIAFGIMLSKVENVSFQAGLLETLIWYSPLYVLMSRATRDAFRDPSLKGGWEESIRESNKLLTKRKVITAAFIIIGCIVLKFSVELSTLSSPLWVSMTQDLSWPLVTLIIAWGDLIPFFQNDVRLFGNKRG